MNQKQREFLIGKVNAIHQNESRAHAESRPERPNLGNHLVADIMAGTAKMKTMDSLREKIHKRVLRMGKDSAFLAQADSWNRSRRNREDDEDCINIKALDIFEEPATYTEALKVYNKEYKIWAEKDAAIDQVHQSLLMKVQLGSDKALDNLIMEADNLGQLSLMNARLTISVDKQLTEGKK